MKLDILSPNDYPLGSFNGLKIIRASEGDQTIGHLGVDLFVHAGPIWIHRDYRRAGVAKALYRHLEENCDSQFFTFPSNEAAIALMRSLNYIEHPYKLFERKSK